MTLFRVGERSGGNTECEPDNVLTYSMIQRLSNVFITPVCIPKKIYKASKAKHIFCIVQEFAKQPHSSYSAHPRRLYSQYPALILSIFSSSSNTFSASPNLPNSTKLSARNSTACEMGSGVSAGRGSEALGRSLEAEGSDSGMRARSEGERYGVMVGRRGEKGRDKCFRMLRISHSPLLLKI